MKSQEVGSDSGGPIGVLACVHGKEKPALNLAKAIRGIPDVVVRVANYRAVVADERGHMTHKFPGNPRSDDYEVARAAELVKAFGEMGCRRIIEVHASHNDTADVLWVCQTPNHSFRTSYEAARLGALLVPEPADIVVSPFQFNLFGRFSEAVLLDIGTESPYLDPEYCRYQFEQLVGGALDDNEVRNVNPYEYRGHVPLGAARKAGMPAVLPTFEAFASEHIEALVLPDGARALSWGLGTPVAGEVVVERNALFYPRAVGGEAFAPHPSTPEYAATQPSLTDAKVL
jgi:hypothetical protein